MTQRKRTARTAMALLLALALCGGMPAAYAENDVGGGSGSSDGFGGEWDDMPMILASGVCGAEGDNLTWKLDSEGVLTIVGTGAMADYDAMDPSAPWEGLDVTAVTIGDGVTSIGDYAFFVCSDMTDVTIGSGVTSIGEYAFFFCDGLTDVALPDALTTIRASAFFSCDNLASVTIGANVTSIGPYAFAYCEQLTLEVSSENDHYKVEDGVLFTKDGKTLVAYPAGKIGAYAIPDGVTAIAEAAFYGCRDVTDVTISDSVTEIGEAAFADSALTLVTFGAGVTTVGKSAFSGCDGLTELVIGESVETVGEQAFYGCSKITDVTIPVSVTDIADGAFNYCNSLADVWYGGTQEEWNAIALGTGNEPLMIAALHTAGTAGIVSALPAGGTLTVTLQNPAAATGATLYVAFYQNEQMTALDSKTVFAAQTYAVSAPQSYDSCKIFLVDPDGIVPLAQSLAG